MVICDTSGIPNILCKPEHQVCPKCLEMPDDGSVPPSTISNPERSDFLGGRRGMTKQKNVELPEFLGPPEKTGKVDVLTDFLGPPEKFDSAPRSRSQSIEVAFFNYFLPPIQC